jgi:hypothetical protein
MSKWCYWIVWDLLLAWETIEMLRNKGSQLKVSATADFAIKLLKV